MSIKNFCILILFFLSIQIIAIAQHKSAKKPAKIWYKPVQIETTDVKLEARDVVSEKQITKFKWIITNNTKNFLIVKPQECNFKSTAAVVLPNDKKRIVINPLSVESKVIDGTNTKSNSVYELNISFNASGIYMSENAETAGLPDFNIPATVNKIENSDFRIEIVSYNAQSNNQLKIKLKVTFLGYGIGIVDPSKISAKVAGGATVPNSIADKLFVLERGENETFTTYFNNFQEVLLEWNDTFKTSSLKKIKPIEMNFEFDPTASK